MRQGILSFEYRQDGSQTGGTALAGLLPYLELACVAGLGASIEQYVQVCSERQGWTDAQMKALYEIGVNAEVARQMVLGALGRSPANIAISVTGVLGPDPDEDGNPPGLVYLAVGRRDHVPVVVQRNYDASDPDAIRREVIIEALGMLQRSASG